MSDLHTHSETVLIPRTATPILKVSYLNIGEEYALIGKPLTVGRADDNAIVIPFRTVSRHHAVIKPVPGGYIITDQNSTNGLRYRGRRVTQQHLQDGDILRISDELGNVATLSYHDNTQPALKQLKVVTFRSDQQVLTIGRTSDNDLVLNHPQVSTHHARIRHDGQRAILEDLGSTNGTYLYGQPVTTAHIQPGDSFQIAGQQLVYREDAIAHIADDEAVRLDALGLSRCASDTGQVLLQEISLSIRPKELVAIVGGSGSGKSTLLHALNGFCPASKGKVLINGHDYYRTIATYRSSLGYMPQADMLHQELTVEQTLYYAARLRLPRDLSRAELTRRIEEVLDEVEMTSFRAARVDTLSGGQRKRVSIAVELLVQPRLFFLDEPTTGLDPGLDKRIMALLRNLADKGCTIILVTHATANITLCDRVAFLGVGGRLCFYGPPQEAMLFFETHDFATIYTRLEESSPTGIPWHDYFIQSPYYEQYIQKQLADVVATPAAATRDDESLGYGGASPLGDASPGYRWRQFLLLTQRYGRLVCQDRQSLLLLAQAILCGLIILLIAPSDIFRDGASPFDAQQVFFLTTIAALLLGANNAAREIAKETPIYLRERMVNLQIVPYIFSKVVVLALLCLIQSGLLLAIIIPSTGVPPGTAWPLFVLELTGSTWLAAMGGVSLGLCISALAASADKAIGLVPLVLLPQIMLAGLIFPLSGVQTLWSYPTVTKWAVDSMGTSADLNRLYYQFMASAPPGMHPATLAVGTAIFDPEHYDSRALEEDRIWSRRWHLLGRWSILSGMILFWLGLTWYVHRRKDRIWEVP